MGISDAGRDTGCRGAVAGWSADSNACRPCGEEVIMSIQQKTPEEVAVEQAQILINLLSGGPLPIFCTRDAEFHLAKLSWAVEQAVAAAVQRTDEEIAAAERDGAKPIGL